MSRLSKSTYLALSVIGGVAATRALSSRQSRPVAQVRIESGDAPRRGEEAEDSMPVDERRPADPDDPRKPDSPAELTTPSLMFIVRRTIP